MVTTSTKAANAELVLARMEKYDHEEVLFCFDRTIACVVLKDGSRVDILNQCLEKPIDLDQADYVLLPGDTKLPVPAAQ